MLRGKGVALHPAVVTAQCVLNSCVGLLSMLGMHCMLHRAVHIKEYEQLAELRFAASGGWVVMLGWPA